MQRGRRRITVAAPSVVAPDAPTLTAPADESDVYPGVAVTVSATVTAGQVPDRVDFVLDPGVSEEVIATDSASPFSQSWTPTEAQLGAHTLVARFVYGSGSVDSTAIDVICLPAGLTLHLRADLGITKDGSDKVGTWADQSGVGNDFLQATAGDKPTWVDAVYNGLPAVRGTDATDHLKHATSVSLGTACTIFLVHKQGTVANNYITGNAIASHGIISRFTGALIEWFAGADRYTIADGPTGLHIYTVRQTNGAALQAWNNGASAFGPVVPAVALSNIATLFAVAAGTNGSSNQDTAELLVWPLSLSTANRQAVEAYLGDKYGITVS